MRNRCTLLLLLTVAAGWTAGRAGAVPATAGGGTVSDLSTCLVNDGQLTVAGGAPTVGQPLDLQLDQSVFAAVVGEVIVSPGIWPGLGPCGLILEGIGEVAIDLFSPAVSTGALSPTAAGPWVTSLTVPNDPALAGLSVFAQAYFVDAALGTPDPVRLSNGLAITFGG